MAFRTVRTFKRVAVCYLLHVLCVTPVRLNVCTFGWLYFVALVTCKRLNLTARWLSRVGGGVLFSTRFS